MKKFFGEKVKKEHFDFGILGTDIHSHFIPGIDDGAATMEDSVNMIAALHELGYNAVVTTPHVMSDYYRNTPEIIREGLAQVREELAQRNIPVHVDAAAEYYVDYEFDQSIGVHELLTFGDNYILIELPFTQVPENFHQTVFKLLGAGLRPILAHPERYAYYHTVDAICELKEKGLLLQINTVALTGHYGPVAKKIAAGLLDSGCVDFLGSDCHRLNHVDLLKSALDHPSLQKALSNQAFLNSSLYHPGGDGA
ncbi:MAG: capsular biosynthesis protein [Flavobacteriales bacterium]|nr:histidinol phosphatase [Flavobacteriales bacterium]MCB9447037.1 capsular biosynthesis protein [Flavobacteriales bacterium]